MDETLRAAKLQQAEVRVAEAGRKPGGELGDRRIGVVWHTQGAGYPAGVLTAWTNGATERQERNPKPDELQVPAGSCQGLGRNENIVRVRAHSRGWSTRAVGRQRGMSWTPCRPILNA